MTTAEFNETYAQILANSVSLLKNDRFAGIVIGEYREKKTTAYVDFVGTTVEAFRSVGMEYYNEFVLINVPGSAPLRAGKYFEHGRKVAKTHLNVLIFVKGDYKKATEYCGDVVGVDLKEETE